MSRSYHSENHLSTLFSKIFYFSFAADIYNIIKENERSNRRQIIKPPARQPAQDSRKRWTGSDPRTARKRHRQPQRAAQWQYIGIMPLGKYNRYICIGLALGYLPIKLVGKRKMILLLPTDLVGK